MNVTGKELAKRLGLSATAVSMALRGRPGVSTKTRRRVLEAAEKYGYDFTRLALKREQSGSIYFIIYITHNAIMSYAPISGELGEGIEEACKQAGYSMKTLTIYEKNNDLQKQLEELRISDCIGIVLAGTEMQKNTCARFLELSIPLILLDTYFEGIDCNCVLINNEQGAWVAANHLIASCNSQPGYLASSYQIENFEKRRVGFNRAVRAHGMSVSKCITHRLSPTIEGAMADMLEILEQKEELARCYFADNDLIAIGVIKALKTKGYRIPEDIAVVGFDNIAEGQLIEPPLTTVSVPRHFMGQAAAKLLFSVLAEPVPYKRKTEISTTLIPRSSV